MAKEITFDAGGPIHAVDHGGTGPPMLLVHGLGGSLLNWRDVTSALRRGHHVWSIDLIGFGRTPLAGRESTIPANVQVVEAVVERIGEGRPVVLVGNSMGGLISILVASRRPGRISSLILVDPALPTTPGGRFPLMLAVAFVLMRTPRVGPWVVERNTRRRGPEGLVDDILNLCTVEVTRISPQTREAIIEQMRWRQEQEDPDRAFLQASSSLVQWLWHRDAVERHILRVKAPTLLMHGDQDRLVALSASEAAAAMRPDWTFRVLAETGHIPQMERPKSFVAIVEDWLESVQPALVASTSRR